MTTRPCTWAQSALRDRGTGGGSLNRTKRLFRVGTAGWSIPRQNAAEFPGGGAHLERYAGVLSCAEINSTFYRSHRPATWARWAGSVPPEFRFAVKAPRDITHLSALACSPEQIRAFIDEAMLLGRNLGPLLFQLPPKLPFDHERAASFFAVVRQAYSGAMACEPRNESWFTPEADSLLAELRVARVAADPLTAPRAFTPGGWSGLVYYRLHGSPRRYYSSYDEEFLRSLADALKAQPPETKVWCIFDNTASGAALGDALALGRILAASRP